jgi:hypothetical protein
MNLRDALKEADRLGVRYEVLRGTGEIGIRSADGKMLRVNLRRKDSGRKLTSVLRGWERVLSGGTPT